MITWRVALVPAASCLAECAMPQTVALVFPQSGEGITEADHPKSADAVHAQIGVDDGFPIGADPAPSPRGQRRS
jgi:hypothetical protein